MIATKHDLDVLLADPSTHDATLTHLQCLMDERYQYDASGAWKIVEPNGLTRIGITLEEAVSYGAVDRVVPEPEKIDNTEQLAFEIRSKRNALISETDYLLMVDYPITEEKKNSVLVYRQALRDITLQETFPKEIIWPILED